MINVESRARAASHFRGRGSHEKARAGFSCGSIPISIPAPIRIFPPAIATASSAFRLSQVDEYYAEARNLPNLELAGLSTHIGSQITDTAPFTEAGNKVAAIIGRLRGAGIALKYLDIGGGLGIPYQEEPPSPSEYGKAVLTPLAGLGLKIIAEPGRVIVGNAGVLVTKVLYIKETDVKRFIVVDAAMNDLIRPVLYEAYHDIQPVQKTARAENRHCRCGRPGLREWRFPRART